MERQNELSFSAVISAAGRAPDGLARLMGTSEKCAALLDGEPICRAAINASLGAGAVQVAIACGPETRAAIGTLPANCIFAEPGAGPVESASNGYLALVDPQSVLLLPGDLPFVGADHVAHFIKQCPIGSGLWVAAGICGEPEVRARFPDMPGMKYLRLSGDRYAGGGIFAASPQGFANTVSLAARISKSRKSKAAMALRFGIGNMLRLLFGKVTLERAEELASELFGCNARIVTGCAPELIADVDTIEDWKFAESLNGRQIC